MGVAGAIVDAALSFLSVRIFWKWSFYSNLNSLTSEVPWTRRPSLSQNRTAPVGARPAAAAAKIPTYVYYTIS